MILRYRTAVLVLPLVVTIAYGQEPAREAILIPGVNGVTIPKLTQAPPEEVPKELRARNLEAKVGYVVTIKKDGSVDDIKLMSCGTRDPIKTVFVKGPDDICELVDKHARSSIAKRRYQPATKDGEPVNVTIGFTMSYLLGPH